MSSDLNFVEFIVDQVNSAGVIKFRKMFGEYALYCDEKVVALICDNQLFVKPTNQGGEFMKLIEFAPPYPGAKDYFLIDDRIENSEWLSSLIKITADSLPIPKHKKKKKQ